ncbi:hypothetical protein [Rhodococcus pyridinivorans]|uniref:hypothetical protein n=1 Tax=Rhodococcus pyridinivorans TaxID=103816 RepID=UPI002078ED71|nr:hypothetical protein [Rhodococcus pyridinivorans]USI92838.1 hypothetical protein LLA01_24160 [Rhodococcus pyridinivorans]USI92890.1 hypothetical protein LLA01_23465 [Rhodococcus pyridinivorans]
MNQAVDLGRLVGALEARISAEGLSWRKAAAQIDVSPALLSRLRNGLSPDLSSYAKIVRWLDMSADDFLTEPAQSVREDGAPVELESEVSALLRARKDLSELDKKLLEELIRAALTHVREAKADQ